MDPHINAIQRRKTVCTRSQDVAHPVAEGCAAGNKYLMTVRPFVQKMDEQLKIYFAGRSPLAELEAVKTALDKADAVQESARAGLPVETANIYVLAGEILDAIETVNRIAKIAFDGRAEIMAQFNKDLTLRGGKTRKATAAEEDEDSRAM